jgi:small subunit ribosomal protein S17
MKVDLQKVKRTNVIVGRVISKKMQKTATVIVERVFCDAKVNKVVKAKRKFQVHDENNESFVGDIIEFYEGRPISKTKYMYFYKVLSRSKFISENGEI